MSMTSTAAEDSRRDDFTYESIKVECKLTRTLVASVNPGGSWDSHPEMYSRDRTSTKNILSTTRKFTSSDFPTTVESDLTAGESFPIDITGVEGEVSLSAALTLTEGFEESTRIEYSLETDTETTFREPVEKTFEGLDNVEKVIYEEKSFYDDLEVTSNLLTTFKEGWDGMEREETFTVEVDVGVGYKWFHVETPGGYRLAIADNDISKSEGKSLLVQEKTEEDGQLWRWHGKYLCNKLGEVMAIDQDGTFKRGANVVTLTKRPEMRQKWEVNGKHIQSEIEGLYLAVRRGGKGSKVCVWTKTDEEDQHWSIFSEEGIECDFEAKGFGNWGKKFKKKTKKWTNKHIIKPIITIPSLFDVVEDIGENFIWENIVKAINLLWRSTLTDCDIQKLARKYQPRILQSGKGGLEMLTREIQRTLPKTELVKLVSKMVPTIVNMSKHAFHYFTKKVLYELAKMADLFEGVRKALMEFDFKGACKAFLKLLNDRRNGLLDKINKLPFGSIQVFVVVEASAVLGLALEVGISLNIKGVMYLQNNFGSLKGFSGGDLFSAHVGFTFSYGISYGVDGQLCFAYHSSEPDGVDGESFVISVEGSVEAGGGIAFAYPLPMKGRKNKVPNQVVAHVSVGAQFEVAFGFNNTFIFDEILYEFMKELVTNPPDVLTRGPIPIHAGRY